MDIPIRFPTQTEVIDDEVARFRALTPAERSTALGELFDLYHQLAARSGRETELRQVADAAEASGRSAILDFVARHA